MNVNVVQTYVNKSWEMWNNEMAILNRSKVHSKEGCMGEQATLEFH